MRKCGRTGWRATASHFRPGGKGGAAPAHELGVGHLADDALGAQPECRAQRLVAAVRPVRVEAGGIDDVHPPEQPERRIARLGQPPARLEARGQLAGDQALEACEVGMAEQPLDRLGAGHLQECRGSLVAEAQAGAPQPDRVVLAELHVVAFRPVIRRADGGLELTAQRLGALAAAGDVVADVQHAPGTRHGGEQRVEGGDAVGVGRRHHEPLADVVERAFADPADARLDRLQRRQQQVTLRPGLVPSLGRIGVARVPDPAFPTRGGRAEEEVERLALLLGGHGVHQAKIHLPS